MDTISLSDAVTLMGTVRYTSRVVVPAGDEKKKCVRKQKVTLNSKTRQTQIYPKRMLGAVSTADPKPPLFSNLSCTLFRVKRYRRRLLNVWVSAGVS